MPSFPRPIDTGSFGFNYVRLLGLGLVVLFVLYLSATVVPAGHVGVKDFFGSVSDRALGPGVSLVVPGTRVLKFSTQTREIKEAAAVPTSEGLIVNLDVSLLFRLRPDVAPEVYKTVGRQFEQVIIEPQLRLHRLPLAGPLPDHRRTAHRRIAMGVTNRDREGRVEPSGIDLEA